MTLNDLEQPKRTLVQEKEASFGAVSLRWLSFFFYSLLAD